MKKKSLTNHFDQIVEVLTQEQQDKIEHFFADLITRVILVPSEKKKIIRDFQRAIIYYLKTGLTLEETLERLDLANIGGFYSRPATQWFALDYAAKIYPLSLGYDEISLFRLSIYLKEAVIPDILQMALTFTIKRFPQFATTLKKGFFWHYLDSTKKHYEVEEEVTRPFIPIKVSLTGSKTFRVLYFNNRISVEIFHALTDGSGGMVFLKTLVHEYFRLLGIQSERDEQIFDINTAPDNDENNNEFEKAPKGQTSGFINKKSLQMSGRLTRIKPCQIIHFKMDASKLKEVAKAHNTTITGYIITQMLIADKYATEASSGDLSVQVPVNMRKFYPSKTIRNFSLYFNVRFPFKDVTTTDQIIEEVNRQLLEKSSKEKMTEMMYSTKVMVKNLSFIPLFIKTPIAKKVYGIIGERSYTNTLSNLGVITFPQEMAKHIESLDFILGTGFVNRAICTLITFENVATLSISKITLDSSFEERLLSLLTNDQIPLTIEGSDVYENVKYLSIGKKTKTPEK